MRSKTVVEMDRGIGMLALAQHILIKECAWDLLLAKYRVAEMLANRPAHLKESAIMAVDAGIDAIHYIVQIMDRAKLNPNWSKDHGTKY